MIFGNPVMADRVHRLARGLTTTTFVCSPFPRTIFGWKQAHLVATSSERRENSRLPRQRSSAGTRDDKPDGNNATVLAGWIGRRDRRRPRSIRPHSRQHFRPAWPALVAMLQRTSLPLHCRRLTRLCPP